jgi:uncharacterized protein DUF3379
MMNCSQYRRAILADPHDADPELRSHLEGCHDCAGFTERLLRFERRLGLAMRVDTPAALAGTGAGARAAGMRRGWLAMAASVLILVAAGSLWLAAPNRSLAADVVAHMAGEPQAWARTDIAVPPADLAEVLSDAHMRLGPAAGMVSYASSCTFRGHLVPHLVVQTAMGPVTVMVLVHDSVAKQAPFDKEGYRGVIVPVPGHGSIAVLARGQTADLGAIKEIAARVQSAIVWTGTGS